MILILDIDAATLMPKFCIKSEALSVCVCVRVIHLFVSFLDGYKPDKFSYNPISLGTSFC